MSQADVFSNSPPTASIPGGQVLLCCFATAISDDVLGAVAAQCRRANARLSVVLVVVDGSAADGCCGIQGQHWERLMDEHNREMLASVVRRLASLRCRPADAAIEVGDSLGDVVARCVARCGCEVVVVPGKRWPWSTDGLSRRRMKQLRRRLTCDVVEL